MKNALNVKGSSCTLNSMVDGESQAGKFTCNITVSEWTQKDCLSLKFATDGVKFQQKRLKNKTRLKKNCKKKKYH